MDKELVRPARNLHNISFKREARKRTKNCDITSEKLAKRLKLVDEVYNEQADININIYNILIKDEYSIFARIV